MNIIDITDPRDTSIDIYASLTEPQLRHYRDPDGGIFIAESCKVIGRALDGGMKPESVLVSRAVFGKTEATALLARIGEVPVYRASSEVMESITGYHLTGGILCSMTRPELPAAEDLLKRDFARSASAAESRSVPDLSSTRSRIAVLENIVNPTNVGAVFRSAAAWTFIGSADVCGTLRSLGYKTAALALVDDSIPLDTPVLKEEPRLAVLIGNEGNGLTSETIENSDYKVIIPMSHDVDSLNAAAASAVAFWELTR